MRLVLIPCIGEGKVDAGSKEIEMGGEREGRKERESEREMVRLFLPFRHVQRL